MALLCVSWPSASLLLPLQVIDDPCGNSFVESTEAPSVDPQLTVEHYTRTQEQDLQLGIQSVCVCVCVCICTCMHGPVSSSLSPSLPFLFPLPLFLLLYRKLLSVNQARTSDELTDEVWTTLCAFMTFCEYTYSMCVYDMYVCVVCSMCVVCYVCHKWGCV